MLTNRVLTSGQINYQSTENKGAYSCVVIKNGQFFNMTEDIRQDLIKRLQDFSPVAEQPIDLEDMF